MFCAPSTSFLDTPTSSGCRVSAEREYDGSSSTWQPPRTSQATSAIPRSPSESFAIFGHLRPLVEDAVLQDGPSSTDTETTSPFVRFFPQPSPNASLWCSGFVSWAVSRLVDAISIDAATNNRRRFKFLRVLLLRSSAAAAERIPPRPSTLSYPTQSAMFASFVATSDRRTTCATRCLLSTLLLQKAFC